ncbi:LysR family transcriptional regulator [Micromonospora kangleipakensis]|uniref:LysR family transcriptional regulator n=1 Tax=Micromonospora kangleipakensis TaxID=1077942 RepID=A0A4Q8BDS3_9ACTN|nr:LysR family transcriptional regulator [Micromonospora kangleipakensis]RZU75343.1 LysR family transcriptional regulator [Micromonospora kangleipakensis]
MVDLRQMEYFLAVVDHGGVTRAAAAICIAQPSLSQAIRGLERELGIELFHRTGHGLVLTAAGEALVAPARQVLRDATAARAAVAEVVSLRAGRLDIAAHAALTVDPLTPALATLRRRFPGISVGVREPRDDKELARLVRDGSCELALTYLPIPELGLPVSELGSQQVWVVLPPGTPAADGPLPVRALHDTPVIGIKGHSALRATVLAALASAGVRMRRAAVTRHSEAVVPMVLAGAGTAFLTRWYADEAARGGAVVRALDPPMVCRFALVHRPGRLSPAARALLELLRRPG